VLEAATNEVAPAANQALRAGLDKRRAPAAEGRKPAGRGGSLVLKIAAVVLLSVGLAAAAYLKLGRPQPLKADDRQAHARAQTIAAGAGRQRPGEGAAVPQEMAQRRERALPPQQKQAAREAEPVPQAPRIPRSIQVTVPPGTEIRLTLDMPLGSSASHAGDTFTATITDPVVAGDRVAIPAGSRVHGRVSEAVPARKGLSDKAGSLSLAFDRVATPAGSGAPMSATMTKVAPKSTKKTAGIIGGSAAGGALLGKVLGGNSRKALIGSVVGGALGAGIAAGTKGQDVDLPAGSPLTIRLDQPLAISVSP